MRAEKLEAPLVVYKYAQAKAMWRVLSLASFTLETHSFHHALEGMAQARRRRRRHRCRPSLKGMLNGSQSVHISVCCSIAVCVLTSSVCATDIDITYQWLHVVRR